MSKNSKTCNRRGTALDAAQARKAAGIVSLGGDVEPLTEREREKRAQKRKAEKRARKAQRGAK